MTDEPVPSIYVLAGPNGGGKSSIMGAMIGSVGVDYFNPDAEARRLQNIYPQLSGESANSVAWNLGKNLLQSVIRERQTFAFETTLGGNTITALLEQASACGIEVRIWFVSLASPELHIQRVQARVHQGGHSIPEAKIRERYERSRQNLIKLLPRVTELRLFDNSLERDPASGKRPEPKLILHVRNRRIVSRLASHLTPEWAKPIVEVATRLHEQR